MRIRIGPIHTGILRPTTVRGLDFQKERSKSFRNYYAVAPEDYVHPKTPVIFPSPLFSQSPAEVIEALRYTVLSYKNTEILNFGVDDVTQRFWIEWSVRTPLLRFPDFFFAEAFPEDPSNSSSKTVLAMCSESLFGLSDMGVIPRNMKKYLKILQKIVGNDDLLTAQKRKMLQVQLKDVQFKKPTLISILFPILGLFVVYQLSHQIPFFSHLFYLSSIIHLIETVVAAFYSFPIFDLKYSIAWVIQTVLLGGFSLKILFKQLRIHAAFLKEKKSMSNHKTVRHELFSKYT